MRIAVVGAGIAGLASAWLLSRAHEVHLVEAEPRLGGHTNTRTVRQPDGTELAVDTGFIVYNEPTYPLLTQLFDELGVATQPSDMSWSLRCERCDLEYAGNARGLFAQPARMVQRSQLRMLADLVRFNRLGRRLVGDPRTRTTSIGRFLAGGGFSSGFQDHYLLPMASAVWSSGTGAVADLPLDTLLRFFDNHGLLGITTHHPWRTVTGGSSSYVAALTRPISGRIHLGDAAVRIERDQDGVDVHLTSGARHRMDAVVLASHADRSLAMLADPDERERRLLGPWNYSGNDTYLHTDTRLLPRRRAAWASWNYLLDDCRTPTERVSLSYHMNRLQSLGTDRDHVVSLNPRTPPAEEHLIERLHYRHPVFDQASVGTQPDLDELNGRHRTYFAGAYQRYGFHEDGLWSAVRVADHLGVGWPA